jgi:hypothetical protein
VRSRAGAFSFSFFFLTGIVWRFWEGKGPLSRGLWEIGGHYRVGRTGLQMVRAHLLVHRVPESYRIAIRRAIVTLLYTLLKPAGLPTELSYDKGRVALAAPSRRRRR